MRRDSRHRLACVFDPVASSTNHDCSRRRSPVAKRLVHGCRCRAKLSLGMQAVAGSSPSRPVARYTARSDAASTLGLRDPRFSLRHSPHLLAFLHAQPFLPDLLILHSHSPALTASFLFPSHLAGRIQHNLFLFSLIPFSTLHRTPRCSPTPPEWRSRHITTPSTTTSARRMARRHPSSTGTTSKKPLAGRA